MTHTGFYESGSGEQYYAPGPEEEKLEPVVEAEEEKQVEPMTQPVADQRCDDRGDGDIGDADEHRGYPPFQALPLPQVVQEEVCGGVAIQQVPSADAEVPESRDEHQGSHFRRHSRSRSVRALCL